MTVIDTTARPAATAVPVHQGVIVPRGQRPAIPGDQMLDVLRIWVGAHVILPPAALDAVTLWIAHSHVRDESGVLVFGATPRLFVLSSEPGSGKSRLLELLDLVCPSTHGLDVEPTGAGLTFTIGHEHATVLLDEADILLGKGNRHSAVRAIINAGYRPRGTVLNGSGSKATRIPVFGALAMAGLDVMETGTGDVLKALLSRGIKIRMTAATGDVRPARLTRISEEQAVQLKAFLAAWAGQVRGWLAQAVTDAPEGVQGRAAEIWEPLLSVADAAGGEWPSRARNACLTLALAQPDADEDTDPAAELAGLAAAISARSAE